MEEKNKWEKLRKMMKPYYKGKNPDKMVRDIRGSKDEEVKNKNFILNLSLEHKEGLSEDQVSEFLSEVISVAEKYNFTCGGGIKVVNFEGYSPWNHKNETKK